MSTDDEYTDLFAAFDEANDNQRVQELMKLIRRARHLYYNEDDYDSHPEFMADDVFDAFVDELTELDKDNEVLFEVGAPVADDSNWEKATHKIAMTSLDKVNTLEKTREWVKKRYAKWLCVQEKLDGGSISCLDGGTPVTLANGEQVPIRDLVENGAPVEVLTWDPDRQVHNSRAFQFHDNGVRDNWVRVTFEDGSSIVVTEDHLFYVEGVGWVQAQHIEGKEVKQP